MGRGYAQIMLICVEACLNPTGLWVYKLCNDSFYEGIPIDFHYSLSTDTLMCISAKVLAIRRKTKKSTVIVFRQDTIYMVDCLN